MRTIKLSDKNFQIVAEAAAQVLHHAGLVVLAFDTVYGFLTPANSNTMIEMIYRLKGRQHTKPLGVVVPDIDHLAKLAKIPDHLSFIQQKVPGPYTFILNVSESVNLPPYCAPDGTIGVRIPDSRLILEIANRVGAPLAQTSANKAGMPNCFSIAEIEAQFSLAELNTLDLIIDGGNVISQGPSQIYDLTANTVKKVERK